MAMRTGRTPVGLVQSEHLLSMDKLSHLSRNQRNAAPASMHEAAFSETLQRGAERALRDAQGARKALQRAGRRAAL